MVILPYGMGGEGVEQVAQELCIGFRKYTVLSSMEDKSL
jgi:hypothetical protein